MAFLLPLKAQGSRYTETITFSNSDITGADSIYQFSVSKANRDAFLMYVKVTLIVSGLDDTDAKFSFGGGDDDVSRDDSVNHYEFVNNNFFPYTVDTTNLTGSDPMGMSVGTDTVFTKTWYYYYFPYHHSKFKWTKGSTTTGTIHVRLEIGKLE